MKPGRCLHVLLVAAALAGCDPRRAFDAAGAGDRSGVTLIEIGHVQQKGPADCGPAALAMVLRYWGIEGEATPTAGGRSGIRAGELRDFAADLGLEAQLVRSDLAGVLAAVEAGRPVIVARKVAGVGHFEVVFGFDPRSRYLVIDDPARGRYRIGYDDFLRDWDAPGVGRLALMVAPREGTR